MSIRCASGQALNNATIVAPAYPFTVGCWYKCFSITADGTVWSFTDTATTTNLYLVRQRSTGEFSIVANGGSTNAAGNVSGYSSGWVYSLARFISATNRRLSVLDSFGTAVTIQSTTSRTATSLDNARIGGLLTTSATEYLDGMVAEWWYTNTDIQPDGGVLSAQTLRQLAYNGPFSIPSVAAAVVDYRSLKNGCGSNADSGEDYFYGPKGLQTWTSVGSAVAGVDNPPINECYYPRPGSFIRPGIV
jgi:hypothetical protein